MQASSLRCAAVLMAFFFSSAKMTVFKEHLKSGAEDFKKGGQRDWRQVLPLMACILLCTLHMCTEHMLGLAHRYACVRGACNYDLNGAKRQMPGSM